jgi:hypothetical protein
MILVIMLSHHEFAITIFLAIAGLSAGLFQAHKYDKAIQDVTVA